STAAAPDGEPGPCLARVAADAGMQANLCPRARCAPKGRLMATRTRPDATVRLRRGGADDLDEVMRIMTVAFQPCFGEAWSRSQCAGILPMHGVSLTLAE